MIHETLESGGSITKSKGHGQEIIVTLMSSKCSLGNVFLGLEEWNDHEHLWKGGNSTGSGKNNLVLGEDRLEFMMHRGCLNYLNGMELGNDARMTFFEDLFHSMGTDDLRGDYCDDLEMILLFLVLKSHG